FLVGVAFLMRDFRAREQALVGPQEMRLAEIRRRRLLDLRDGKPERDLLRPPEKVAMLPAPAHVGTLRRRPARAEPHGPRLALGEVDLLRQRAAFRRAGGNRDA